MNNDELIIDFLKYCKEILKDSDMHGQDGLCNINEFHYGDSKEVENYLNDALPEKKYGTDGELDEVGIYSFKNNRERLKWVTDELKKIN